MSITTTNSIPQYIATATVPDLTTIFTPPASCSNRWVAAGNNTNIAWSTYSRDGYSAPVDSIYYSCLPRNLRGPHYSPGICTEGQTIASMTKFEDSSRTMWQAQCCKSGMTISVDTIQSSAVPMCVSTVSTPLPVRALLTTTYTNGAVSSMYEYAPNDQSTKANMTTMTRGTAIADPLYVAFEAKDLSLFPIPVATNLAKKIGVDFTPTATPAGTPSGPGQTGSAGDNGGSSDSGLSTGAKIGIGVGAGGGALLLIGLLATFFLLRRRKAKAAATKNTFNGDYTHTGAHPATNPYAPTRHEMAQPDGPVGAGKVKYGHMHPEGNGVVNELDSQPVQHGHAPAVELDGSQRY